MQLVSNCFIHGLFVFFRWDHRDSLVQLWIEFLAHSRHLLNAQRLPTVQHLVKECLEFGNHSLLPICFNLQILLGILELIRNGNEFLDQRNCGFATGSRKLC